MNNSPLISIGMPVYNGALHIGFALEGLLAQSFGDFELIISDNASTDGTRDVVEEYRRRDSRIRYERQPANVGANRNYSYVALQARGELFKWASSSDWCDPTLLDRCKRELLTHDDAVLAAPRTRLFQGTPSTSQDYEFDIELLEETPSARLRRLCTTIGLNNAMNGLIRTTALRQTRLLPPYLGADIVLMGHLALLGKFRLVNERLLYRRMETATATALQNRADVWRFHLAQLSPRFWFQGSKRQLGWACIALSAPMALSERCRCLQFLARKCYWERKFLVDDLHAVWSYIARGAWPD